MTWFDDISLLFRLHGGLEMAPRFGVSSPSMASGQCTAGRHGSCVGRFGQGRFWMTCACSCGHSVPVTRVMSGSPTYGCSR